MKSHILKTLGAISVVLLQILLVGCDNANELTLNQDQESLTTLKTLAKPTFIGDEVLLPVGTKWRFTSDTRQEVVFELPEGFEFLLFNEKTNEIKVASFGGGYSCTCTGDKSCTVFYNSDLGYGCLQSECTGSCIGKNAIIQSDFTIEGVLYTANDMVDAINSQNKASLSKKGKELLFEIPAFQKEIKRTYDVVYKYSPKPDFSDQNLEQNIDKKTYIFVKTQLYGFDLALIIPNDPAFSELMPNLQKMAIEGDGGPTSCSCSGGSEGGNCKLQKKGLLGYVAYYCNGCTTCTMN